ncbi:MAG: GAF domain-containing protein [Candidatus Manganitrophaceae bacterium]|nr:MAG: GAF domain-containing protein [Candidatus Manganitrophaceae bacterium]
MSEQPRPRGDGMEIPSKVQPKRKLKKSATPSGVSHGKTSHNGEGALLSPGEVQRVIDQLRLHQHELESQNEELRRAQTELEASRNRYSDLYDFAPVGYFTLSRSGLITEVNLKGANLLGVDREFLLKKPFYFYVFKRDRPLFHAHRRSLFKEGKRALCEIRLQTKAGTPFYVQMESILIQDSSIGPVFRTVVSDITLRKQAEEERAQLLLREQMARSEAERICWRFTFLAEASETLSSSLDYETSLARVARLVVPYLADGCVVDLLQKDQTLRRVALAAADPSKEALGWDLIRRYPPKPGGPHPIGQVLQSGRSLVLSEISDQLIQALAQTPKHLKMARSLGLRSAIVVPLLARERVLGALSLLTAESDRRYGEEDLVLAKDLARRIAAAVDNARLYQEAQEEIAERKRAEEAIQAMNQTLQEKNLRIEEASRARNRFFSYMSHELKTPVNSIVGFTQLLKNGTYGPLSPKLAGAVGRIHNNAGDLIHLINNILDLAKLESGKKGVQAMEVDLRELVDRVFISFEPMLQEKGLSFQKEIGPGFPERFLTDPTQVRSILTNLLSNAVKFTERGEVRLRLDRWPEGSGVVLEISDTGVGISPEYRGRIFEEYEQRVVMKEVEGKYTGSTGLGLAIVKRMVDSFAGRVEVASVAGEGSTFTIFLPEQSPNELMPFHPSSE